MFIYETRDIFAKEVREGEQEAKSYKGIVFCSNDDQLPAEVGQEILIVPADNPVSIVATVKEKPNEESKSVNFYKVTRVEGELVFEKLPNGATVPSYIRKDISDLDSPITLTFESEVYGVIDSYVAVSAETSSGHTLTCLVEAVPYLEGYYLIIFRAEGIDESWLDKNTDETKYTTVTVTAGNSQFIFDIGIEVTK